MYDLVDLLGARLSFDYLSPDRTYLGATLFWPGYVYVWPGNPFYGGMMPMKKGFYEGTIIIDRDLDEGCSKQDLFTKNFTVMHECFHFDKHQSEFKHTGHMSMSFASYKKKQVDQKSALYKIERQANYAAAAFLMPREAVLWAAREMLGYREGQPRILFCYGTKDIIREMGELFGVNYSPMVYRLQEIGVLDHDFNPYVI